MLGTSLLGQFHHPEGGNGDGQASSELKLSPWLRFQSGGTWDFGSLSRRSVEALLGGHLDGHVFYLKNAMTTNWRRFGPTPFAG